MKTNVAVLGLAALLLSLVPAVASAQEEHPRREYRLDFEVPSAGVGLWGPDVGLSAGFGVLFAHRSGHGGAIRARGITQLFGVNIGTIDAGYTYRIHAVGDDWLGLGVTFGAGGSFGSGEDSHGFWTTTNGPAADGGYAGGYAEASLDFRAYGFLVGLGTSYHLLAPTDAPGDVQHTFEAHLTLGFGFVM